MSSPEFNLRANLSQLHAEIAKIPGITEAEAKKMVVALGAQFKRAEKAASDAAKSGKESAAKWEAGLRGVEKAGRSLGGVFGQIGGAIGDLKDAFEDGGASLGAFGGAAVGFIGTMALVAGAMVAGYQAADKLADSTRTAVDRLREIDGAEQPPIAVGDALMQWDEATLRLEASTALLTTQLGTHLLPAASSVLEKVNDSISGYQKFFAAINAGVAGDQFAAWAERVQKAAEAGSDNPLAAGAVAAKQPLIDLTKITVALTAEEIELGRAYGTVVDEVADAKDAEDALNESKRRAREQTAELAKTEALRAGIVSDLGPALTEQQKLIAAYDDEIGRIDELEKRSGDHAEAEALRKQATRKLLEQEYELEQQRKEKAAEEQKKADDEAAKAKEVADKKAEADHKLAVARAEEQRDAYRQATDVLISTAGDAAGAMVGLVDEGSAAYKTLFALQKGAAIAGIGVDTARSVMAALTIPPPAGPILAAANATTGAVQLATVVATAFAPKAHSGSSGIAPDEQITLKSEGKLQHIGKAMVGGNAGVAALNRGEMPGGGGSSVAVLQWRNRVMDGPIAEMGKLPGSSMYNIKRDGRKSGMRQRPTRLRRVA